MPSRKSNIIELSQLAEGDLEDIAHYTLLHFGAKQVDAYLEMIDHTLHMLDGYPDAGRLRTDLPRNYRSLTTGEHLVIYRHEKNRILVSRILHSKMDVVKQLLR